MTSSNIITEDDRYRTSTQFRLWSFTRDSLNAVRTTTNRLAADRVREAVRRAHEALSSADASDADLENPSRGVSAMPEREIDCLTVEEELRLVTFYCRQTLQLGDHLLFPTQVKTTAVQYIKRFYITNSLMTYDPATILRTALYFATKTENHYCKLTKFAEAIDKTRPEDVLASEFLLTQGLRFTFDVRHPFRALEGAVMEMNGIASGVIPYNTDVGERPQNMGRRVKTAHGKAREYLKTSALLTDVYFHYTPSQIMMATLLIADQELTHWYIASKIFLDDLAGHKILATLAECACMLQAIEPTVQAPPEERKAAGALSKKLKKCRNPEKIDLVALQRVKREGDGKVDEKIIKKRKLEREQSAKEGEDLFGPSLKNS
ncbi:cyclin-like protein [Amylocarpus encephaloides]|uniref:RNA polymerase II holoenzyme cyclin-like subunit n=1 Tax=Amylocarpus encephaloides TaxID=45428 RepID=A0A9P7YJQ3_9HELO|nr:cyclin-like protein [Amylocarpus encephaloides]